MYCIGQRKFVSLQQLVDHYQVKFENLNKMQFFLILTFPFRELQFIHLKRERNFSLSGPFQNNLVWLYYIYGMHVTWLNENLFVL